MKKQNDTLFLVMAVDGVPSEIQVVPFGKHDTVKGSFVMEEKDMAAIVAEFSKRQNDTVIDYEHQSLGPGEAPAAGWIKKLVNKGKDGLWAVVEWTERAKEYLKNKEYRYLSPVIFTMGGRVVQLVNAALTNRPAIDGMVPLVNSLAAKDVLDALGLKEGAGIPEITGAIRALKDGQEGKTEQLRMKEATDLVESAMREGKVTPAEKELFVAKAKEDPEWFKAYVKATPVKVILKEIAGKSGPGEHIAAGSPQSHVQAALGIDNNAWAKHSGTKEA